jgi:pSer/pThr/pTyr-binding forkhead associated (FHA) protein
VEFRSKPTGLVAVLIGIKGELIDEIYKIRDGENRVGRTRTLEVVLGNDEAISREHAVIVHKEGAFFLQPSREAKGNPTRVNGAEVDEVGKVLSDGDTIGMGKTLFCFRTAAPRTATA